MKRIIFIAVAMLALTGCQKADNSTPISSRDTVGRSQVANNNPGAVGSLSLIGYVRTRADYQEQFNETVRLFMETAMPRDYVGYVDALGRYDTGVYIGGRITLQNNVPLRSVQNQQVNIMPNSEFLVQVFDTWDDNSIPAIKPFYFRNAEGYVRGNQVYMRFSDEWGSIELEGTYDNQYMSGGFKFTNFKNYDGSQGENRRMHLGDFAIPTCQLFRCQ